MKSPITGKEMPLIKKKRNIIFECYSLEVINEFYKCGDSGEMFTTTELDEKNIKQINKAIKNEITRQKNM